MSELQAINETSYLSVPNAPVYRKIMRCFYREYEKMNFKMYKEDIFQLLKKDELFRDYTMEQLVLDLDMLVKWKNLTPIQDPGRVYTIAEYKNKQYQYTMSEYAVEIERLTVRLENIFVESGNLSTNFFVRLEKSLNEAELMQTASLKEVNEWWNLMQEDFRRLNQNYQDYLRDFYSGKSEQLMKSVEFIVHKDKFIKYLNEFIQEMQRHSRKIERLLEKNTLLMENSILEKVVQSELEIPHATLEIRGNAEPSIRENVMGKWNSLKNWFIDSNGRECECKKVLKITNDIIRSIIQNAALIVQIQNWGISRKDDYKKFLHMFLQCEDLDEARRLSAHVFGVQKIQHFKTIEAREEDSINNSVYDEEPSTYLLKPHTRNYREKKDKRGFEDKTFQKMIQREAYLKQARKQKEIVMHYIRDNKITFSEIDETVEESTRAVFLQWISLANMSSQKTGRTEYGQEYRLTRKDGTCVLKCEDGNLVMPSYILEFK
ncbi:TIGR02677 family protein [Blautia sp. CLA-JM-H16]|uniref:TIGR02677 family protein n=1 Tax=Blautia aquisgranensis TaxID=3133153 RepID=A0ABV1BB75_9FIRM